MKKQIFQYIKAHQLLKLNQRLIVGISGGRDSVSMVYALKDLGYNMLLAHCNFNLRGKESDEDETFVRELAKKLNLELLVKSFDTKAYAKNNGISIQMAARDLRYEWFEKISIQEGINTIALAHNQNDVVETFFINLIRGTGIDGITGIKARNGKLIRPMLNIPRDEINKFIKDKKIAFREDSSNASNKYLRNQLRNQILPQFKALSENFDQTMVDNMERFSQVNQVYKSEIAFKKSKTLIPLTDQTKIDIHRLKQLEPTQTYLYEFLKPYGFSVSTIEDMVSSLDSESGKQFLSKTHRIIKNRDDLIIEPLQEHTSESAFFDAHQKLISTPKQLEIELIDINNFKLNKSLNLASLDFDKLKFPLLIRKWENGDFFMPLGMNRMKKLSDFLIDNKVPLNEKDRVYVLQSDTDIVWVIGMRIDDRYKVSSETRKVYLIKS